uniref:SHUGOSHIN 2-like isoform X2 n=1 Tax=Erigeron canadensis TaxID=72917 RepID=UPI001CB9C221|nr:SHUGOSHIN 2-like isoform X2 [Erigeron canadensis]
MEGISVHNTQNDVVFKDTPKMAKESIGNSGRKMLADISNVPQKPNSLVENNNKSRPNSITVKEFIDKLQKENATLVKLLADKKIIDLSGTELHKLRITLQKMQMQNLQLAQTNSQMLAELNSGKDRLKDLQHQLGCKNGLLVAKQKELEGKRKITTCETKDVKKLKVYEPEEMGVCTVAEKDKEQQCNTSTRLKSKSLGPSVREGPEKDVRDNGRIQARRQSARFKHEEPKPREDVFHADNVNLSQCSLSDEKMHEDDSSSVAFSVKKENIEDDFLPNKVTQESRRASISRPSRVAAKKVQSYKEIGLQVKMRRPE